MGGLEDGIRRDFTG